MAQFEHRVTKADIHYIKVDDGDSSAGRIEVVKRSTSQKDKSLYRIYINKNHKPATQFCTLAHELGHLFLGRLGIDPSRKIPECPNWSAKPMELEAESVAYIICKRHGVESKSETYLANFVAQDTKVGDIDTYRVTRAAGEVERIPAWRQRCGCMMVSSEERKMTGCGRCFPLLKILMKWNS